MKILSKEKLIDPRFIKPYLLNYEYKGKAKKWEVFKTYNSVSALLYHKQKDALVVVKQLRPALLFSSNELHGYTYELCAGLDDKNKSLVETMKEEIEEEVGFKIPLTQIKELVSCFSGSKQSLFVAVVDEGMKVNDGGGIDGEDIEVVYIPSNEVEKFIFDENKIKTPSLLFAFQYFLSKYKNGSFNG